MVTTQASHLLCQDPAIFNIIDHIGDLTSMMKDLQASIGLPRELDTSGQKATRSIGLDLLKFQGTDTACWIFQTKEYFHFHGITDDSRIQIAGFHMAKAALSWMRGLHRNNLLSTWDKFKRGSMGEVQRIGFDDKLQELSHL